MSVSPLATHSALVTRCTSHTWTCQSPLASSNMIWCYRLSQACVLPFRCCYRSEPLQEVWHALIRGRDPPQVFRPQLLLEASKDRWRTSMEDRSPQAALCPAVAVVLEERLEYTDKNWGNSILVTCDVLHCPVRLWHFVIKATARELAICDRPFRSPIQSLEAIKETISCKTWLACHNEGHLQRSAQQVGDVFQPAPTSPLPSVVVPAFLEVMVDSSWRANPEVVTQFNIVWDAVHCVNELWRGIVFCRLWDGMVVKPYNATLDMLLQVLLLVLWADEHLLLLAGQGSRALSLWCLQKDVLIFSSAETFGRTTKNFRAPTMWPNCESVVYELSRTMSLFSFSSSSPVVDPAW